MLEQPLLLSHPHPQFVAAKSLMLKSSVDLIYSTSYVGCLSVFPHFLFHRQDYITLICESDLAKKH